MIIYFLIKEVNLSSLEINIEYLFGMQMKLLGSFSGQCNPLIINIKLCCLLKMHA